MSFLVIMVLILIVMWVLMIRPQRQRQREHQLMIDRASEGDDILTTGGIYGTITEVDGDDLVVELAEGVSVHMTRRGIAAVLPPEDEEAVDEAGDVDEAEEDPEAEVDAGVVAEAEAVDGMEDVEPSAEELRERTREGAV